MHPTHIPIRVATGAYILNSGLSKLGADPETAEGLHGMASTAYPFLKNVKPKDFTELLAYGEIALGTVLLAPMVPSAVAGTALAGFGAGLVGMYLKVPGLTQADGIRPTQQGVPIAKDVWLVGAGITLATQGALGAAKSAAKSAKGSVKHLASDIGSTTKDALPFG
jgi:hypothetical protein